MSKKHNERPEQPTTVVSSPHPVDPVAVIKEAILSRPMSEDEARAVALELRRTANQIAPPQREIPWYRQCPICWGTSKGVGKQSGWKRINGSLVKTYYRCDKCPHEWSHEARESSTIETIEHREVEVKHTTINITSREGAEVNIRNV